MLKNIPISELIKVLALLQKESSLCTIELDEKKGVLLFIAVRDPQAIVNKTKIEIPKDPITRLNLDDLDKLVV